MADLSLTKSEMHALRELDGAPDKTLRYSTLRSGLRYSARLTPQGISRVLDRLQSRLMVNREGDDMALTFRGMQALEAAE